MHLKMALFRLNIFKKSDDATYNYVLKDVKGFIQEIKSMEEKINLSLFEDFFWIVITSSLCKKAY